jgi:acetyl/propionyl-CoA carboxylase alpha subunit
MPSATTPHPQRTSTRAQRTHHIFTKLLIANRGEIAIRIARAAAELGIPTVAVHSLDDASSLHVRRADEAVALEKTGAAAYLDIGGIVAAAKRTGCDAIHPGYGFLAENPMFARRAVEHGIVFVGPSPEALDLFGDKVAARRLAMESGVPVIDGTSGATSLDEANNFFARLPAGDAVMIKAVAGGGGRGMRAVRRAEELAEAYARCRSEAKAAFGEDAVYVERLIDQARHIEVQIVGDRQGGLIHVGERECTIQRRHQKLIEMAPSPSLSPALRQAIIDAALRLGTAARYDSLGTIEFLVDTRDEAFFFIEANARLQVEHTVTEEVFGIDLVQTQLRLAADATLAELGLRQSEIGPPRGYAIELRVNMETMAATGEAHPSAGTLQAFEVPSGPGVRVDTYGYVSYRMNPSFDSLLAKVIVHAASSAFGDAVAKARRALREFDVAGVDTNIGFLGAILDHEAFRENHIDTRFVEDHLATLLAEAAKADDARPSPRVAGAVATAGNIVGPAGTVPVPAPLQGSVVSIEIAEGDALRPGQQIAVLEAMKMEHLVVAGEGGVVRLVAAKRGDVVAKNQPLIFLEPGEVDGVDDASDEAIDLDAIRPDLLEMRERQAHGLDENRPDAVARRRKTNQRTARENIADLVDPGSFIEYGSLAIAAQRARRTQEYLVRNTPADGVVTGIGTVNGTLVAAERARTLVAAYDYTVLAGTQGQRHHKKLDRMFSLAERNLLPVVLFAEGGGGRPGETERLGVTGLDVPTFGQFARLSGAVPLVGIVSGRCFAGNAALLGCCDVIIATADTTVGMGGPAMIEGGGLGVYQPEDVGPVSFQAPNGVIDVLVADEQAAVAAAKQYLAYFQGSVAIWDAADQRLLRRAVPENRLRVYEIRDVIELLADQGSVLELRRAFGVGIVTALIRIEGRPMGLIANNPRHLGGAIDSDAADKAARFMQLCDAYDLPIVSLCDTPGFMVGPEAEKTALVRHVCRMFVTAASLTVPYVTVVLRKGYGLGAQAMAGGGFHAQLFTVAWPSGEFGGMGLEGAVRLGFRQELDAVTDPVAREKLFAEMVAKSYEQGKAINIASVLEIDQVIDPRDTRHWILSGLRAAPPPERRMGRKRPFIDTW